MGSFSLGGVGGAVVSGGLDGTRVWFSRADGAFCESGGASGTDGFGGVMFCAGTATRK